MAPGARGLLSLLAALLAHAVPLTPPSYQAYPKQNCYNGHGGTEIGQATVETSVAECQQICTSDRECECVTYFSSPTTSPEYLNNTCWKRTACNPAKFDRNAAAASFTVYVKSAPAPPTPTPPPPPPPSPAPSVPKVLVVYGTETNFTAQLAQSISYGAIDCGAQVVVKEVTDQTLSFERDVIEWADALVFGSPTHFGNPSAETLGWVRTMWEPYFTDARLQAKIGGVFATGGGVTQGIEHVLAALTRVLDTFRFRVVTPDPTRSGFSAYGAVAITGTPPFNGSTIDQGFVAAGKAYGRDICDAVNKRKHENV